LPVHFMLYNRRSQNVELDLGNLVLNSLGASPP
jgi:hypothetical protein